MKNNLSNAIKKKYAHTPLAHTPTPLERLPNLSKRLTDNKINLWIKRDDCTGLGAGGNKARQLEFYVGQALSQSADTLLTTGAVQSNHVRMTVAAACKMGMQCEIQSENRVPDRPVEYYESGNPFLTHLMAPTIHTYADGEDEQGADRAMHQRAQELKDQGKTPYVIPLASDHEPIGALGYVLAAEEILQQAGNMPIDAIVLATGSAMTHSGLLTGLRALGCDADVHGICVRRDATLQQPRILERCHQVGKMIGHPNVVSENDIIAHDDTFAPGYGQLNEAVYQAIFTLAQTEAILLDPTYTGKAMAGMLKLIGNDVFSAGQNVIFLHTGGLPGAFGYPELLKYSLPGTK